jgi:hypothetical protein
MKNLDKLMTEIDKTVDKKFKFSSKNFKKYFAIFSTTVLVGLLAIFLFKTSKDQPIHLSTIIKNDLEQIEKTLSKIDKECNILSILYNNVRVDFLNVEKFSGSTIGCLNLAYPQKWQGPYLPRNPSLQGKFYEIVKAQEGFFLIPGSGVKLPNGLALGKNIKITAKTQMSELIMEGGPLNYKGQALATRLKFKIGDWDAVLTQTTTVDKINTALKEFNEAISFTKLDSTQNSEKC